MNAFPPSLPDYLKVETAARVRYAALPLKERLITTPPLGYNGAWLARIVAPCVKWLVWFKSELSIVDNHGP